MSSTKKALPQPLSDTILAPMAGVTDVAFRLLCQKYGAGLTMTEMISANALARSNQATLKLIDVVPEEKIRWVQLFGQNTENLVRSAQFLEKNKMCEMIDLNFGCPASQIVQQGAGSALLERPNKIKEIVQAVSSAVKLPVTCKIRLGIRINSINVLKVAQICAEAGAQMLIVHARTQKQGYTGKADWSWIKKVKEIVDIPICGNGDVRSVEDYLRMKQETGCDYVMIGRGAIGNPLIFKQINDYNKNENNKNDNNKNDKKGKEQFQKKQIANFLSYLKLAEKYKVNSNNIKFHAQSFTKGVIGGSKLRLELSRTKNVDEIKEIVFH
jgi:nifR3 family TIM-barrel protein